MAVKYKGNKNRKFTEKETTMQVLNYDESICIVFSNMPRTAAREIVESSRTELAPTNLPTA